MRAILAGAILTLASELVLALAFWAGSVWLAGSLGWLWGGVVLASLAALSVALLLAGDLDAEYQSEKQRLDLRFGWIARVTSYETPGAAGRTIDTRVLFLRWTRILGPARPRAQSSPRGSGRPDPRSWFSRLGQLAEPMSRAFAAAAQGVSDLIWDAREMTLRVQSPTQLEIADRALAGLFGSRRFGPLEIQMVEGGERSLVAHYRIPLYRAVLTSVAAFVQGRPDRVARELRPSDRTPKPRMTQAREGSDV